VSKALAGVEREFTNAVPGRRFRIDIALPASRLAIEVDGWEWHGKHKGDFTRDRERQNLLTLHGWRILRFTAGQIRKDVAGCVEMIRKASMVAISAPQEGRPTMSAAYPGDTGLAL
jgi:very-short-patch-repair endonuclease